MKGLFRSEGQEDVRTPASERARFVLQFGSLEVGELTLSDGSWTFEYSDAFKAQADDDGGVKPIIDFPDVSRVYESEDLWPFFMARIPSLSQPRVLEEIERKGLDRTSAPQLLRAFGERTIANPFLLRPA